MKIQVRVNEEGALRNQRYAFTDRFTLVRALAERPPRRRASYRRRPPGPQRCAAHPGQWARHRGLPEAAELPRVRLGRSNLRPGAPLGIGFTKCQYAASHVVVFSGQRRVAVDTAAALRREAFEVETAEHAVDGTVRPGCTVEPVGTPESGDGHAER